MLKETAYFKFWYKHEHCKQSLKIIKVLNYRSDKFPTNQNQVFSGRQ